MCNLSEWVFEQGIEQGKEETAINLIRLTKFSDEEICDITELPMEHIKKLRKKIYET